MTPNFFRMSIAQRPFRVVWSDDPLLADPTMTRPFTYSPIVAGSDYSPLLLELVDVAGNAVDLTGATFAVTVKDELTGATIVQDGAAAVSSDPYVIEYFLAAPTVTTPATWLVEWKVTASGGKVQRSPVCRLPVLPKL